MIMEPPFLPKEVPGEERECYLLPSGRRESRFKFDTTDGDGQQVDVLRLERTLAR
jgi:hypothetical protein